MNTRFVFRQLGLLTLLLGGSVLVVGLWDLIVYLTGDERQNNAVGAQLGAAAIIGAVGAMLYLSTRGGDDYLGRREALLLVALSWLLGAAMSALPYFLWAHLNDTVQDTHPFRSFIDCLFESMSGLTTTGATVLGAAPNNIEGLPPSLLLWRALTHWIGGLGIVVLFVAVLPMLGVGGKKLLTVEAPVHKQAGMRPRIAETARILLTIYIGLNLAQTIILKLCGLSWFDAACESMGTIATGGFSNKDASTAGYRSLAVEIVLVVFMMIAGVNFGLFFQIAKGQFRNVWRDTELRWYLAISFVACTLVVLSIAHRPIVTATGEQLDPSVGNAVRYGVFTVVTTRTNTGFATADINPWGFLAHFILLAFMYTGACAGSTAGGVKMVRCLIAFKMLLASIERVFRPNVVKPIRIGRTLLSQDAGNEAVMYLLLYAGVLFFGGVAVLLIEPPESIDWVTAMSASAACISNSGPGLNAVGTVGNYGWMTGASKLVLSMVMLLGRLEVYALFVLFVPRFWRTE